MYEQTLTTILTTETVESVLCLFTYKKGRWQLYEQTLRTILTAETVLRFFAYRTEVFKTLSSDFGNYMNRL